MNMYEQEQKAVMIAIREYIEALPTYQGKSDALQEINLFIASLLHDVIHTHVDNVIAVTKQQIQGQQKQTLYDWSDPRIPKWVNWIAMDNPDDPLQVWGYDEKPTLGRFQWGNNNGESDHLGGIKLPNINWRESLEERPK